MNKLHLSKTTMFYSPQNTPMTVYQTFYALRETQLFAHASQWLRYYSSDDLLNAKWYHTKLTHKTINAG